MKIAFISTFFTGATLPLMKHLADKGHTTDLFLLCKQGLKGLETLPFDEPVFGNRISQIRQENQIYNYLNFERSKIYLTPYSIVVFLNEAKSLSSINSLEIRDALLNSSSIPTYFLKT